MSGMYKSIKMRYDLKRITAADVWSYADEGIITEDEAMRICGPRPKR